MRKSIYLALSLQTEISLFKDKIYYGKKDAATSPEKLLEVKNH